MTPADVNAYYNSPNNYIGVLALNPLEITLIPRFVVVLCACVSVQKKQCSPWQVFVKSFEVKQFLAYVRTSFSSSKVREVNHLFTDRTLSRLLIFLS